MRSDIRAGMPDLTAGFVKMKEQNMIDRKIIYMGAPRCAGSPLTAPVQLRG